MAVKGTFTFRMLLPLYLGMALVTFLPRYLPMAVLSRRHLPEWLERWLSFLPTAILAAQSLAVEGQRIHLRPDYGLAALPAFMVAWRTRNLFWTVLVGVATMALLRAAGIKA
ncbi:MAG: AzlD domain-containing protein [Bacillota bacterium]